MPDQVEVRLSPSLRMAEALLDAMDRAVPPDSSGDVWRYASFKQYMRKYNDLLDSVAAIEPVVAPVDRYEIDNVPNFANTLAMQQRAYFEDVRANLAILCAYLANRVNPKAERIAGIADFLASNLRRAMLHPPERERDVQDVVEQLLIGKGLEKGLDYDRESGRVKVSSKEVVPDFNLLQLATAIEVKLVKDGSRLGAVIDEVNADILAYSKAYKAVVFVVYDVAGGVRDDAEFRRDLEAVDGVRVIVVKH